MYLLVRGEGAGEELVGVALGPAAVGGEGAGQVQPEGEGGPAGCEAPAPLFHPGTLLVTTCSTLMKAHTEPHPFVKSAVAAAGVARAVVR